MQTHMNLPTWISEVTSPPTAWSEWLGLTGQACNNNITHLQYWTVNRHGASAAGLGRPFSHLLTGKWTTCTYKKDQRNTWVSRKYIVTKITKDDNHPMCIWIHREALSVNGDLLPLFCVLDFATVENPHCQCTAASRCCKTGPTEGGKSLILNKL